MLFIIRGTRHCDNIAFDLNFHVATERLGQLTLRSFHLKHVARFNRSSNACR